jgi:hypothetical protein
MIQAGTISTGSAPTVFGDRRILDQLDQRIAEDDLARCRRQVSPDDEIVEAALA